MKPKQEQIKLQVRLKMYDDIFNNVIIALERLEHFKLSQKSNEIEIKQTASGGDRDYHNNEQINTNKDYYLELELQCLALFRSVADAKKNTEDYSQLIKFFFNDLFSWYGGRHTAIEIDDVDKYFLVLATILNERAENATQVREVIKEYVIEVQDLSEKSDHAKVQAIESGMKALILGHHESQKRMTDIEEEGLQESDNEILTHHIRGDVLQGVKRLFLAMSFSFENKLAIYLFTELIKKHFPEHLHDLLNFSIELKQK